MAAPKPLSRVSVNDAVLEYTEVMERRVMRADLSETSLNAYKRDLDEFVDLFGADTILDDIEADDIETAMSRIAKSDDKRYTRGQKIGVNGSKPQGRGQHSLARWFAATRGMFRWAADRGYVQVDPTSNLKPPKVPKRAKGARLGLPLEKAQDLRAAPVLRSQERPATKVKLTLRDETILRLLTESGPRVSEVVSANRSDINTHDETGRPVLRVIGKGRKERYIPLSTLTVDSLQRYLAEERPTPPRAKDPNDRAEAARVADAERALFVTVRGWRMNSRDVQRMVEKYAKVSLDRHATPHALRHTALTILARSGTDIATIAQIAGHENLATTSIYMDESMTAATEAIDSSPLGRE